ncbi:MAG: hypothetical protein SNH27_17745 [Rikenellaceae bacterium]
MASYRDFEKLWEQYQKEGVKRDISIELYCKSKGIVYAHFERWYREYFRKKAYEVEITNCPETDVVTELKSSVEDEIVVATLSTTDSVTITKIDLRLSNGIEYHAEQITGKVLTSLITKLEAICLG